MAEDWISINLNAGTIERAERFLKAFGKLAEPGIQRAMNRAIVGVGTDASKVVREAYNVKARDVKASFTIYRAGGGGSAHGGMHGGSLQVSAVSRGRKIPMMSFRPRPATASRKRMPPIGASAMIQKGVRKAIPGAFVGTSGKGDLRMYVRSSNKPFMLKGKRTWKLRPLTGPSIPQMIGSMSHPEIFDTLSGNARQRYEKNFAHEMDRLLERLGVR